jgi:hypothetical protein
MASNDVFGKYTVWATRRGKKEVSQRCATRMQVAKLKAEWEALGYVVQVFEYKPATRGRASATNRLRA